jgi:hypothetical protein
MKTIKVLLFLPLVANLVACAKSETPFLQTPAQKVEAVTVVAGKTTAIADPKVTIVFVTDNSGSMDVHQETMKNNISTFASKFFLKTRINYRIGVVPVYDRFYSDGQAQCRLASDVRKMNPRGELVPLKGAEGKFIDRATPNGAQVLKDTIKLGVRCGPEAEESFEPVLALMEDDINASNDSFYEKDSYLVVIFLTNADDANYNLGAQDFYNKLVAAKGGDKSKLLFAAAVPNSNSCATDAKPTKILELIKIANDQPGVPQNSMVLDLCSNKFGAKLAEFGEQIVERVGKQQIELGFNPDNRLKITYGTDEMPEADRQEVLPKGKGGYTLLPGSKSSTILLDSELDITPIPEGKLYILAYPINPKQYRNGQATTQGE